MARGTRSVDSAVALRIPERSHLLLAVSGGIDSIVLLHALVKRAKKASLVLEIAHVDHALRKESRADQNFVASLATEYDLPFHSMRLGTCPNGENFESWARARRYEFFQSLLEARHLSATVTAHHCNDVAETLLMKLIANKQLTTIRSKRSDLALLRPLFDVTRETIERYAEKYRLQWKEDSTNRNTDYFRNNVRHTLLPFLIRHFDVRIVERLAQAAQRIDGDLEALNNVAKQRCAQFEGLAWGEKTWLKKLKSCLRIEQPALALRVLAELLEAKLGRRYGWEHLERVHDFILHHGGEIELPGGVALYTKAGRMIARQTSPKGRGSRTRGRLESSVVSGR